MREWSAKSTKYSEAAILLALDESASMRDARRKLGIKSFTYRASRSAKIREAIQGLQKRSKELGEGRVDRVYASKSLIAALDASNTVRDAAKIVGCNRELFSHRARREPEFSRAFEACRQRSAELRRDAIPYNRLVTIDVLKSASSRKDAAQRLSISTDKLLAWVHRAPKTLRPLYDACAKRAQRPFKSSRWSTEEIQEALRTAPSLNDANKLLGMSPSYILRLCKLHPEFAALKEDCAKRGMVKMQIAFSTANKRRVPGQKAAFCFRDHVGKFARLRRDLTTGNGRGVTYTKGTRFKAVKHSHMSFSIVRVDVAGNELVADNAWGRYFVAGVTRRYLDFETNA